MEHNPGLTDDQDVSLYIKRNLVKQKEPAIKIIRDEEVGRFAIHFCLKYNIFLEIIELLNSF